MRQVRVRDDIWRVESEATGQSSTLYQLRNAETGERMSILSPPDVVEELGGASPVLDRRALSPFGIWQLRHELIRLNSEIDGLAALHAGRVQLEPYQLVPVRSLLRGPRRSLLIADDVGLGKTVEAGLCLTELIARGVGQRVLLVVPPGLIDQWIDEMSRKFGLVFKPIEDSASLDQAQTALAEGVSPWSFHDRVITSIEYLKRSDVHRAALRRPWDVIVVDEAHYLAESGSPANPYSTRRTALGQELRKSGRSLILLTATPHNGYRHSFRSLLELVEPTAAALAGEEAVVRQRVARSMVRRLKQQITRTGADGSRRPAFIPRAPVERLDVHAPTLEEREVFRLVTEYCSRTAAVAAETDQRDLVSFAMQIVKKRMLSSRLALARTVESRLDALKSDAEDDGPSRGELRELQGDIPLPEVQADRIVSRVLRSAVPRDARRRNAEKRQLQAIQKALRALGDRSDPKIDRLLADLHRTVAGVPGEKAIVFTEYRDTLEAVRVALSNDVEFAGRFVELPGGLTAPQRRDRIAEFTEPNCLLLLATDAASEGLNLQEHCRRLYHLELPWNPNRMEQRNGRIDRYGQRREPQIAYLFYADSPEDRVLDRLISRISQMQSDRVSTPDIVGILETTRLPDRLLSIFDTEDADSAAESLVRVFEEEQEHFAREVAPLLASAAGEDNSADAMSADPLLADDLDLEAAMLRQLGGAAQPAGLGHEYRVTVPAALQGPGVQPEYDSLTFRRSVALMHGMESTEFVHRHHPLARAAAAQARAALAAGGNGTSLPPRLAARRLAALEQPAAVFTFFDRSEMQDGTILSVGLYLGGAELPSESVDIALHDRSSPGEVHPEELFAAFTERFADLTAIAERAAARALTERMHDDQQRRATLGIQLRSEVDAYRQDRVEELDREEAAERLGSRDQTELFREVKTNWQARRAAVATHAEERLRAITEWENPPSPPVPEPLGVLFVFPEVPR